MLDGCVLFGVVCLVGVVWWWMIVICVVCWKFCEGCRFVLVGV